MKPNVEQAVSDQLAPNKENMKYVLVLIALTMFAGCASGPTKILVKNCKAVGSELYTCEEIPKKDIEGRR
jgi:uncharacterized lipoprotein YajG